MTTGAPFDSLSTGFAALDPALALLIGIALGVCATLGVLRWSHTPRKKADPLSGLFAGGTLDDQLTRIADPEARSERKDRAASAVRAKMFAQKSTQAPLPPHLRERFDHAAVLDHIAKVMCAGTQQEGRVQAGTVEIGTGQEASSPHPQEPIGEWEEVLLLPAPSTGEDAVAKAA